MRDVANRFDFGADVVQVAAAQFADVHHHVQLARALVDGFLGFEDLGGGGVSAVGEANHRADDHVRPGKDLLGQLDVTGFDADRGNVIVFGHLAPGGDLFRGQLGAEQGMVDNFREFFVGNDLTVQ